MKYTQEETDRALKFVGDPDNWPMWPFLPLKRIRKGILQAGFLFNGSLDDNTVAPEVYIGTIYDKDMGPESRRYVYDSIEAVFEKGWKID